MRARWGDAERERLPPVLERSVLDVHRDGAVDDVADSSRAKEVGQVAVPAAGANRPSLDLRIERLGGIPELSFAAAEGVLLGEPALSPKPPRVLLTLTGGGATEAIALLPPACVNPASISSLPRQPERGSLLSQERENPAIAGLSHQGAYGIRTRAAAVRGRCPRPLDECARRAQFSGATARGRAQSRTMPTTTRLTLPLRMKKSVTVFPGRSRPTWQSPIVAEPSQRTCGTFARTCDQSEPTPMPGGRLFLGERRHDRRDAPVALEVDDVAAVTELRVRPELVLGVHDLERCAELRAHRRLAHAEHDACYPMPDPDRRRRRSSQDEGAGTGRGEENEPFHARCSRTASGLECGYRSVSE